MGHLCNDRLNRIFEVAGVKYLPGSEPAVRGLKKWKVVAALQVEVVQDKTKGMKKWRRASLQDGVKTSDLELMLAKPLSPPRNSL
jgi:hypothetical protein